MADHAMPIDRDPTEFKHNELLFSVRLTGTAGSAKFGVIYRWDRSPDSHPYAVCRFEGESRSFQGTWPYLDLAREAAVNLALSTVEAIGAAA